MTDDISNKKVKSGDIDLLEILRAIKAGKKIVYKSIIVSFILGIIISYGTPNVYKSEVTLLVENESKQGNVSGLLQQFGGMAGLNLGSIGGTEALSPQLYPDIIKSTPFLLEIMNKKITESRYDSTVTVSDYLDNHTSSSILSYAMDYSLGLPGKILSWIKKKHTREPSIIRNGTQFFRITQKQSDITKTLLNSIKAKEGESNNILVISAEMQDPFVSAQLTDSVVSCLTRYIIDYRTQKAKNDLQFISDRETEAEQNYHSTQNALATYRDQNKNVVSAFAKTEEERLQAEYTLAFNVYNTLSQQLEQSKIKVQQETPVFKILNPAQVPLEKSKPKTILILVSLVFFGVIAGVGIIFIKSLFINNNTSKD